MKQLSKANNLILSLYLFIMLGFFPLYYRYQYADMGDSKYKVFLYVSSVCVAVSFLLCVGKAFLLYRETKSKKIIRQTARMDITNYIKQYPIDVAVLVLGKVDDFSISSQVVVAETVIVGQVPDMFLQTGGIYELQRENK